MILTVRRSLGLLGAMTILVAACSTAASPSAAPSGAPSTAPTTAPTEAPSAAPAEQTLTYAIDGEFGFLTNGANDVPTAEINQFLHTALYQYNANLEAIPALAAKPAEITEGGKVWTITLRDGLKFSDGSPLTSADVVNSYLLAMSPNCRYNPSVCLGGPPPFVAAVEAIDPLTVKFTLTKAVVTFQTIYLPAIYIESKAAIAASYATYKQQTAAVTADEVAAVVAKLDEIDAAAKAANASPDYTPVTADMEALLTKAGMELADKALYTGADGTFDAAGYATDLGVRVRDLSAQFTAPEIDALAAAYPYLTFQKAPVGAGAWKVESVKPGESITAVANDNYYLGTPQISKIFFPLIKDDIASGQALVAGQIDWDYLIEGATYKEIKDDPNLKFAEYPEFGYYGLYFNMRDGTVFGGLEAGKPLRQAVAWCIDKPATVEAATSGAGVAVYSDIPPASWAYANPDEGLQTYQPRDVAKAKSLIEGAGWTLGSDGIYEKDGQKLSTVTAVRAGKPDRAKFMQLLSDQVKECGIDIKFKEVDFATLLNMIDNYPHINAADPAGGKPFDTYFGGFSTGFDPDPYSLYHSSQCTTPTSGPLYNYICYNNPKIDQLIEAGLVEFDQAKRTEIYKQYAIQQSEDLPMLYAWSNIAREGLRTTVNTTDPAGFKLDSPAFMWEYEKLTNIK